jgi:hypothetical protein
MTLIYPEMGDAVRCKKIERMYWVKKSLAMAEGITMEQTREKIYQDLLNKGDKEKATLIHQYQDKVHPLKTDNQPPPSTTNPPSSQCPSNADYAQIGYTTIRTVRYTAVRNTLSPKLGHSSCDGCPLC